MVKKDFNFDSIIETTQRGDVNSNSKENVDTSVIKSKRTRGRPKAIGTQKKKNFNIRIPEDTLMKLTGIAGDIQAETKKRTTVSDIICSAIDDFIAKKEEVKSK